MARRLHEWGVRFASAEEGATAIEYGLIAALIAVTCIGAFTALGGDVSALWQSGDAAGVMRGATDSI